MVSKPSTVVRQGRLSVVPALKEHIKPIAFDIRLDDYKECLWLGYSPEEALTQGFEDGASFTLMAGGLPIGMMGVVAIDTNRAWIWFLGTDEIEVHWRDFLRGTKKMVSFFHSLFPLLQNIVPMESPRTVSWLSWAGFGISDTMFMVNEHQFLHFVRCQQHKAGGYSRTSRPVMN